MTEESAPRRVVIVWDFDAERAFLENLLHTRTNFFLASVGAFSVAGYASEKVCVSSIISIVGLIICLMLAVPIMGTQMKINAVLEKLRENPDHPINFHEQKTTRANARNLISFGIPVVCILFLLGSSIFFSALCSMP